MRREVSGGAVGEVDEQERRKRKEVIREQWIVIRVRRIKDIIQAGL